MHSNLKKLVDGCVQATAQKKYDADPILGPLYSRRKSVMNAIQIQHGNILEETIVQSLRESNRHDVFLEPEFKISRQASEMANSLVAESRSPKGTSKAVVLQRMESAFARARGGEVMYGVGDTVDTLQVDGIVDHSEQLAIRSYEIKRANSLNDSRKIKSIQYNLIVVQLLLKSYGERERNLQLRTAESLSIFYYGKYYKNKIPASWVLTRKHLDGHFGYPIVEQIEEVNNYLQAQTVAFLNNLQGN